MSDLRVAPVNLDTVSVANTTREQRQAILRQAVDQMVGATFFGPMLKMAHNSALEGKYGHGGRGEEVFQGQLDQLFAQRIGQGMKNGLSEAIYQAYVNRA